MTAARPASRTGCPCGRTGTFGPLAYENCCGRYLDDATTPAPDAESLMRSRYTAYALRDDTYVLATWAASTRPARIGVGPAVRWLGLQVLDHRTTGPDTAQVEFVATYRDGPGRPQRLHERSRFARQGARWSYLDGEVD